MEVGNFCWIDVASISKKPKYLLLLLGLHFNYQQSLGFNASSIYTRLNILPTLSGYEMEQLGYVQKRGWEVHSVYYPIFQTRKLSRLNYIDILYEKHLSTRIKLYYIYLASIIPLYNTDKWIPEEFVLNEYVEELLQYKLIDRHLNGYILKQEIT